MEIIASEFKAKCLHLMDVVADTGEPLIITKHGKAIVKLVPCDHKPATLFGISRNVMTVAEPKGLPSHKNFSAFSGDEDNLYE